MQCFSLNLKQSHITWVMSVVDVCVHDVDLFMYLSLSLSCKQVTLTVIIESLTLIPSSVADIPSVINIKVFLCLCIRL